MSDSLSVEADDICAAQATVFVGWGRTARREKSWRFVSPFHLQEAKIPFKAVCTLVRARNADELTNAIAGEVLDGG
jgi:hypothetical protein